MTKLVYHLNKNGKPACGQKVRKQLAFAETHDKTTCKRCRKAAA